MIQLIVLVFNAYALGLIAFMVLSFAHWLKGRLFAQKLEGLYKPFLIPLKELQIKTFLRQVKMDLSPVLLLVAIFVARQLVIQLLF